MRIDVSLVLIVAAAGVSACGRSGYVAVGSSLDAASANSSLDTIAETPDALFLVPDVSLPDVSLPDAPRFDAPLFDAPLPDAPLPDAPLFDAPLFDAFADAVLVSADASSPDASLPADATTAADASAPDARTSADRRCIGVVPTRYDAIGMGTPADPYVLCNPMQFSSFMSMGPGSSHYRLGADITMPSWTTRTGLSGSLDGDDHALRVMASGGGPMIADLTGEVRNLRLALSLDQPMRDRAGVLAAGCTGGTIRDVHLTADFVSARDQVGGLVGFGTNCIIEDVSVVASQITGRERVGGVIGEMFSGRVSRARVQVSTVEALETVGCARLGGIVGFAHDGAVVEEASFEGVLSMGTTGAGGIVGVLGLGSTVRDVIVVGQAAIPPATDCGFGVGGVAGSASGATIERGRATLVGATAGMVDRLDLGSTLRDVAGLTPDLDAPIWVLRSCVLGSTVANTAVHRSGVPVTGAPTCTFPAPRVETDLTYFWLDTNAPMSSWDGLTIWQFGPAGLPMLRRIP